MRQIGAFEAKNTLSALLDLVEQGEEVVITRHGHPVARLVPPEGGFDRKRAREAAERIWDMGKTARLDGLGIKDLINEGRKY
ncbi:type II toxin-antitoxin system Phd/YefM family antitoxin [Magnetospirillum sp. UT-4]|uniref:type II toxin-antitoxin system Phd/YefM family antitoxin n=1 Tax=Magnetospirillum sp. UT-4 TaxID=2681467 RepID=UPI001381B8DA|nr:type II toxin-antitoxin system prevent-host-death family antitoxin [Magnetospirillum sp. UT-4]CAA7623995.1 Prevent-host-death family protein [Magnetospirillum sp. UT-4]